MKIYLDLIMILNFFFDFLLLVSVSVLLKRRAKVTRIIYASFIGGISILFLFINISSLELFFFKFIISIFMILIAFGYKNIKYTLMNTLYLYVVSVFLGGGLYLLNIQFSYKQVGIVFYNNGLSINIIVMILLTPIIIYIYIKQGKRLRNNYSNYYDVRIYFNDDYIDAIGYLDTGNNLVDPITSKPVILMDKRKMLFDIKEFMLIPYYTVSGRDMMKCLKIDMVVINKKEYKNVLLGIIDDINLDGVDVILNNKMEEIC